MDLEWADFVLEWRDRVEHNEYGTGPMMVIASKRFAQLKSAYRPHWAAIEDAHVEDFSALLSQMAVVVVDDLRRLCETQSPHLSEWFQRECREKVDNLLRKFVWSETGHIRRLVTKHLAYPHVPLREFIAANGDPDVALSLQKARQAVDRARQPLSSPGLLEPQRIGELPATSNVESNAINVPARHAKSWPIRLRAARDKAELSRTGAAKRLNTEGVRITSDAIKKHEEGKATPRPDVRRAYAAIYKTPENELFHDLNIPW